MSLSPVFISLKTATCAIAITFVLGTWLAYVIFKMKNTTLKALLDALLTLPLVLPPTVAGFFLLYIFGVYRPVGAFLAEIGMKLVFSWPATVLAAVVISLPLMYRSAKAAFLQVDSVYLNAARTLGMREAKIAFRVLIPLARPGLASGGILSFTRGLGEFGATAMIAGNILSQTRTMPLAIYSAVSGGNADEAQSYVLILLLISLVFVLFLSLVFERRSK